MSHASKIKKIAKKAAAALLRKDINELKTVLAAIEWAKLNHEEIFNYELADGKTVISTVILDAKGNVAMLKILRECNININVKLQPNNMSVLHLAVIAQDKSILEQLLRFKDTDPNTTDDQDKTALHYAVAHKSTSICRKLIKSGVDLNKRDKNGSTALHLCVENSLKKMVSLCNQGANTSIQDNQGNTPLHVLLSIQPPDMLEKLDLLLKYGCIVSVQNYQKQTALGLYTAHPSPLISAQDINMRLTQRRRGSLPFVFSKSTNGLDEEDDAQTRLHQEVKTERRSSLGETLNKFIRRFSTARRSSLTAEALNQIEEHNDQQSLNECAEVDELKESIEESNEKDLVTENKEDADIYSRQESREGSIYDNSVYSSYSKFSPPTNSGYATSDDDDDYATIDELKMEMLNNSYIYSEALPVVADADQGKQRLTSINSCTSEFGSEQQDADAEQRDVSQPCNIVVQISPDWLESSVDEDEQESKIKGNRPLRSSTATLVGTAVKHRRETITASAHPDLDEYQNEVMDKLESANLMNKSMKSVTERHRKGTIIPLAQPVFDENRNETLVKLPSTDVMNKFLEDCMASLKDEPGEEEVFIKQLRAVKDDPECCSLLRNTSTSLLISAADSCCKETALHIVSEKGFKDALIYLIDQGADVNAVDDDDMTCLHMVSNDSSKVDIVKVLLQNGSDREMLTWDNQTAFNIAIDSRAAAILGVLLEDFTVKFMVLESILNQLVGMMSRHEMMSLVLKHINCRISDPSVHLIVPHCAKLKHWKLLNFISRKKNERHLLLDLNKRDDNGWAAIHYCAQSNQLHSIQLLQFGGASLNRLARTPGARPQTAMAIASEHQFQDIVEYLKLIHY